MPTGTGGGEVMSEIENRKEEGFHTEDTEEAHRAHGEKERKES
jgi:hypothetical protein